jgi:plasmid stability protein
MRNVTVTLDEEVAKWARVWAAKHDTSVSRMLGEFLREKMQREDAYWKAYEEWKAMRHVKWDISGGKPLPKREEIYTRGLGRGRVRR